MTKRTTKRTNGPLCLICGATTHTEFPLLPETTGFRFGEICHFCDVLSPIDVTKTVGGFWATNCTACEGEWGNTIGVWPRRRDAQVAAKRHANDHEKEGK